MSGSTTTKKISSIALGAFDGIHIAHQELIQRADGVVIIEKGAVLTPGKARCKYVDKPCFFYQLSEIKDLDAKAFVELLKRDFPQLKKIVVGYDFAFGKDRRYSINDLKKLFDGEVEVVEEIKLDGVSVHSRVIKEYLKEGRIQEANRLLGRCYQIEGRIVKGLGLGSKELVPTINLEVKEYLLPKEGVYLSLTNDHPSLTFIGKRESVDGSFSIETHLLRLGTIEYPKICFIKYLRPNRKFGSLKELKQQIQRDIALAKEKFRALFSDPHFSDFCRCR